jgi:hypothetical protein
MELWISGEIQSDVDEGFTRAFKLIEPAVNECIGDKDCGGGLKKWYYIAIILGFEDEDYGEVAKCRKSKKEVEFRLKIDHAAFLAATTAGQVRLMSDSLLRSIKMMPEIGVKDVDFDSLYADVSQCLSQLVSTLEADA